MNPDEPSWAAIQTLVNYVLSALERIHDVWSRDSALVYQAALRLDPGHPGRHQLETERVNDIREIIVRIEWLLDEMYDADHPNLTDEHD
jgi:hypothetical protein